jgi:hypothetical protein
VFTHLDGSFDYVFTFEDSMSNVNTNESNTIKKKPFNVKWRQGLSWPFEFLILQ